MSWLRREGSAVAETPFEVPDVPDGVVQICHPDWRGVKAATYSLRDPVIETADFADLIPHTRDLTASGVSTVVIRGWPPNAGAFAAAATKAGITVLGVFHSSPAQHGVDGGEAEAVHEMFSLMRSGDLVGLGTDKVGVSTAFRSLGHEVAHVGNRVPVIEGIEPANVRDGTNVGIGLSPMWRKNVTTQILAALELGWHPFVMADPQVPYLSRADMTVCGELSRHEHLAIQAAMDVTFNVTLAECHPMMPMESYVLGVPCLFSRTSGLFVDDKELWELTTADQADNPSAIAAQAQRLKDNAEEAVERAQASLRRLDAVSAAEWVAFTRHR
jgi:hypothetical protein